MSSLFPGYFFIIIFFAVCQNSATVTSYKFSQGFLYLKQGLETNLPPLLSYTGQPQSGPQGLFHPVLLYCYLSKRRKGLMSPVREAHW